VRCVILQPSYIPWRGYFDLIRRADIFVFYDDVQYDARGWRNRNRIKSPGGSIWLTIPVSAHGAQTEHTPILDIETADMRWSQKHFKTLLHLYRRAPHFERYEPWLRHIYAAPPAVLAEFTIGTTIDLARMLGVTETTFIRSSQITGVGGAKTERLISILQRVGATHYLSGPSAKNYIDEKTFTRAGIALEWMTYDYPEYPQMYPPFDPQVSILDLLLMTGTDAPRYIWG
jgi:hypothetical protein